MSDDRYRGAGAEGEDQEARAGDERGAAAQMLPGFRLTFRSAGQGEQYRPGHGDQRQRELGRRREIGGVYAGRRGRMEVEKADSSGGLYHGGGQDVERAHERIGGDAPEVAEV